MNPSRPRPSYRGPGDQVTVDKLPFRAVVHRKGATKLPCRGATKLPWIGYDRSMSYNSWGTDHFCGQPSIIRDPEPVQGATKLPCPPLVRPDARLNDRDRKEVFQSLSTDVLRVRELPSP